MSTDLNKLRVSLTKHGAHKVAYLVHRFSKDEVLKHIDGDHDSIIIDYAQAHKILSANQDGSLPVLWDQLKQYGQEDIYDIVFIANVFSHVDLIRTMIEAIDNDCKIKRGSVIDGKAYTNFAHTIDQFGYSIEHTSDFISFDISRIFYKFYLTQFIADILAMKLTEAGWDKTNSLADECVRLNLNSVFGLTGDDFLTWLQGVNALNNKQIARSKARRTFESGIKFRQGHRSKHEGDVRRKSAKIQNATMLHNHIQNNVYELLLRKYPQDKVGTEVPTNTGSIDIVRKSKTELIFYEIKTENDIKSNIRSALSQLLEYAYWNKIEGVEQLIIIGPNIPTSMAIEYLDTLRNKFNLPIFYQYYDIDKVDLKDPV
jgi:hypothetical protein